MKNVTLKWVIAHEPAYLFYRVAEDFKNLVNEKSKNVKIDIEILTDKEYNSKYKPENEINRNTLWKALKDNTVQIAQMTTTSLSRQFNRQMHVLDLPYLFDDHGHAAEILDGPIGQELLNGFDVDSKLKGLSYTYSGGFRLMTVDKNVKTLAEIVGSPMRSGMSGIAQDTISALGFIPVPTEVEELTSTVREGKANGGEHVAQRLFPDQCDTWTSTIINTNHSLFLTSIVVNKDWWDSLDSDIQDIFSECAHIAAVNERQLSILDGEKSIKTLQKMGVNVVDLTKQEIDNLKEKTQPVYDKYEDTFFKPNLVRSIKR